MMTQRQAMQALASAILHLARDARFDTIYPPYEQVQKVEYGEFGDDVCPECQEHFGAEDAMRALEFNESLSEQLHIPEDDTYWPLDD